MTAKSRPTGGTSGTSGKHGHRKAASTVRFDKDSRYIQNYGVERLMTVEEYRSLAKQISVALRMPTDPPPRPMAFGRGLWNRPCQNVRALLEERAPTGSVLVRGYRLHTVPLKGEGWKHADVGPVWKAMFDFVVAHPPRDPSKSDKWIYECATAPEDNADRTKDFIFVPSSRGHTELTDEQLLSGEWLLGTVIGGNQRFCDVVAADNVSRGRERSMICRSPERCIAKRLATFGFFPHFASWYQQERRNMPLESMAEVMGFPCVDVAERDANPTTNFFDEKHVYESIGNNTNALVDGGRRSHRLWQECEMALYAGGTQFEHVVARMHAHYDALLEEVEEVMEQRFRAAMARNRMV